MIGWILAVLNVTIDVGCTRRMRRSLSTLASLLLIFFCAPGSYPHRPRSELSSAFRVRRLALRPHLILNVDFRTVLALSQHVARLSVYVPAKLTKSRG